MTDTPDTPDIWPATFQRLFDQHRKHLRLKGLRPKTIEVYSYAIRRVGEFFDHEIEHLTVEQLVDYFDDLRERRSWSSVKHDLYGLKFFYEHVLNKPWPSPNLVKPPKSQRLPDIVTVDEAGRIFASTRVLTFRSFFFVLYSLGLRLGEAIGLQVGDIDAERSRVQVRNGKGNRDRFVPLPQRTLQVLREFWCVHRNPLWLFPERKGGVSAANKAQAPLHHQSVQTALHKVVSGCGLKKTSRLTACATAMPPICWRKASIC